MPRILIVEDEMSIADALVFALETQGWTVQWLRLGQEAIDAALDPAIELVILDVGLPDVNGFDVCRAIRKRSEVPILFLTARGEEIDRIVGLEIGADDYVVKPFSPREVATRVRVILRRIKGTARESTLHQPESATSEAPGLAEFSVDRDAVTIRFWGALLQLTPQEFRLLAHLVEHPGRVFARSQLLQVVGAGLDAAYERNIDTHVKALRGKLREVNDGAEPIATHRGFGYSYKPSGT